MIPSHKIKTSGDNARQSVDPAFLFSVPKLLACTLAWWQMEKAQNRNFNPLKFARYRFRASIKIPDYSIIIIVLNVKMM